MELLYPARRSHIARKVAKSLYLLIQRKSDGKKPTFLRVGLSGSWAGGGLLNLRENLL